MSLSAPAPTPPLARTPRASQVEMNELVLPTHTNVLGSIFGGQVMAWIDICAALAAMRHAGTQCVTASMDALDFILPIKVGHVVNLRGMVNFVGRTSLEVGVRVEAGSPMAAVREHVASAYLTFVALGPDGRPTLVPPLLPEDDLERLRWAEAEARRAQRLALASERKRLRAAHEAAHAELVHGAAHPESVRGAAHPESVRGAAHPESVRGAAHPESVRGADPGQKGA